MKKASLLFALVLLLPAQVFARADDSRQPIQVEADNLEVRDKERISIYSGNVRLQQGSMLIRAERLQIHFDDQNKLNLMEMSGAPATFKQIDRNQKEMRGEAEQMQYRNLESTLVLMGKARFSHNGDTIESGKIRINTETEAIEAGSSKPEDRVKMLIQPNQP